MQFEQLDLRMCEWCHFALARMTFTTLSGKLWITYYVCCEKHGEALFKELAERGHRLAEDVQAENARIVEKARSLGSEPLR